jgi:hypothetical protein
MISTSGDLIASRFTGVDRIDRAAPTVAFFGTACPLLQLGYASRPVLDQPLCGIDLPARLC